MPRRSPSCSTSRARFPERIPSVPANTSGSMVAAGSAPFVLRMSGVVSSTSPRRRSVMTRTRGRSGRAFIAELYGYREMNFTLTKSALAVYRKGMQRMGTAALIVGAWAVLTLPLVFFRGYNSDEGLAVVIARTALEDGYWLSPHTFNVRFVERPTLLSWIIAAISEP